MIKSPFFIIACGRSGTTLLRMMLNNHPHVAIPLESLFIIDYLLVASKVSISKMKKMLIREYELVEWGLEVTEDDFSDCLSAKDLINKVHELYMMQHKKKIWGQKTPRFVRYGALLKSFYPEAKFIHVIRDPRAVVSSLSSSNVHRSNAYYGALRWKRDVEAAITLKENFPESVLEIHYEDLVSAPEKVLKLVCQFLELDFDASMLSYHETSIDEYGRYYSKIHSKLKHAPSQSSIDLWKNKLTSKQISLVEGICYKLMQETGYALEGKPVSPNHYYVFLLKLHRVIGQIQQFFHYLVARPKYLYCNLHRKYTFSLLFKGFKNINY